MRGGHSSGVMLLALGGALGFGMGSSPPAPVPVTCGSSFEEGRSAYEDGYLAIAALRFQECLDEQPGHREVLAAYHRVHEELAAAALDPDPVRRSRSLRVVPLGPWDLPPGAPPAGEDADFDALVAEAETAATAEEWSRALLLTRQAHTLRPDCVPCRERVPAYRDAVESQLRQNHRVGARHALMGATVKAEALLGQNLLLDPWLEFEYTQKSANILADMEFQKKN